MAEFANPSAGIMIPDRKLKDRKPTLAVWMASVARKRQWQRKWMQSSARAAELAWKYVPLRRLASRTARHRSMATCVSIAGFARTNARQMRSAWSNGQ